MSCFFCVFSVCHSIYAPFFRDLAALFWYFCEKRGGKAWFRLVKFRDSRLSLERCCVLLIFSCFFVTFSAMVFEVFVQEKVRSTWRLVEVACFSRCPARFFASFPAFSKPKIDGYQRNLPELSFIFYFKNQTVAGQFMVEKVKLLLATQGPKAIGDGRCPLTCFAARCSDFSVFLREEGIFPPSTL